MGVPKRRTSKTRKNKRRSEWRKISQPTLVECPQCHELKAAHTVCKNCGYYGQREVISK